MKEFILKVPGIPVKHMNRQDLAHKLWLIQTQSIFNSRLINRAMILTMLNAREHGPHIAHRSPCQLSDCTASHGHLVDASV